MDTHFKFPIAPEDAQVGDMIHGDIHGKHWCESIVDVTEGYLHTMRHMLYFDAFRTLNGPVIYRLVSNTPKTTLRDTDEVSLADARPGMWAEFDVPEGEHLLAGHYSGILNAEEGCSYLYVNTGRPIEAPQWFVRDYDDTLAQGVENLHIYRHKPELASDRIKGQKLDRLVNEAVNEQMKRESYGPQSMEARYFRAGWLAGHRKALEPLTSDERYKSIALTPPQSAFETIARLRGER